MWHAALCVGLFVNFPCSLAKGRVGLFAYSTPTRLTALTSRHRNTPSSLRGKCVWNMGRLQRLFEFVFGFSSKYTVSKERALCVIGMLDRDQEA